MHRYDRYMEDLKQVSIRVPKTIAKQMKTTAKETGRKLEYLWAEAGREYLDARKPLKQESPQ